MLNLFVPNIELTLSFPTKSHVVFCKSLLGNKIEKYFYCLLPCSERQRKSSCLILFSKVSEEVKVSYSQEFVTSQNAISLQQNLNYINLDNCLKVPTQLQFYL
jgi:hypothetical protein